MFAYPLLIVLTLNIGLTPYFSCGERRAGYYQKKVLDVTLKEENYKQLTLKSAQRALVVDTSQGKHRYRCKEGKRPDCESWNNFPCKSGCLCNGNCNNSKRD